MFPRVKLNGMCFFEVVTQYPVQSLVGSTAYHTYIAYYILSSINRPSVHPGTVLFHSREVGLSDFNLSRETGCPWSFKIDHGRVAVCPSVCQHTVFRIIALSRAWAHTDATCPTKRDRCLSVSIVTLSLWEQLGKSWALRWVDHLPSENSTSF